MPLYGFAAVHVVEAEDAAAAENIAQSEYGEAEFVSLPFSVTERMEENADYDVEVRWNGIVMTPVGPDTDDA